MSAPALLAPGVAGGERAARRTLRAQLEHLEAELAGLEPAAPPATSRPSSPRLLSLAELEVARDRLADQVARARGTIGAEAEAEQGNRILLEEMLLAPQRHRWRRVTSAAVGQSGCRQWHVRPRFGLLGVLGNWWRVHVSSGCP
ncbi:MAG TPA: hypothetical protein VEX39_16920 [Thermoleophilaceae bacterium]|nr:hypothetical protein [Thermoleophilaceae bacterium]